MNQTLGDSFARSFHKSKLNKMLMLIVRFCALFFILACSICCDTANAAVEIEPDIWQVGLIDEGTTVTAQFAVKNTGSASLSLKRIFHSCDCLKVVYRKELIPSGGSSIVKLELTALGLFADFEEFLYIETDDSIRPIIRYPIKGKMRSGGRTSVYPTISPPSFGSQGKALVVHFFFSPTCGNCDELRNTTFRRILDTYGEQVAIVEYDMSDDRDSSYNYRLLRAYENKFGITDCHPAEAFVGDSYVCGKEEIKKKLFDAVTAELRKTGHSPVVPVQSVEAPYFLAAVLFGLLDGLNPCVFAGLVFFLSYLLVSGLKGWSLLAVGLVYSLAVFLTYIAIGLTLFGFFYSMDSFPAVNRVFGYVIAGFTFLIGALSLIDAWTASKGNLKDLVLKLPPSLANKMHELVRKRRGRLALFSTTFALGVFITVIEGACTGLQYIPAARMMMKVGESAGEKLSGLLLLFVYNAAFIVPLLVLLGLVVGGAGLIARRAESQARTATLVRIVTGLALIALSIAIVILN